MKLIFLEEVDSTHTYLKEMINKNGYIEPVCIITQNQTNGVGSRGNLWQGQKGNLFFSFVIDQKYLPEDLKVQSASIYFSFILKKLLKEKGSNLWLKWPNDFYCEDKKIGGTITTLNKNLIYCGIGLNLINVENSFGVLDISIDIKATLEEYFKNIKNEQSWKQIFSEFKIEFNNSREYKATVNNKKISLRDAILIEDGSIEINNTKVFSLR